MDKKIELLRQVLPKTSLSISELPELVIKPKVGDIFKHNFKFSNEQALLFSQISGDINPIHISEQYAGKTIFGRCIIHGFF